MRDIRKWATMHKGRVILEGLHKIWLHGLLQQYCHRAIGLDVTAEDR